MKAILVDDDDNALSVLEIKLKKFFPSIEIIAKMNNPALAIDVINQQNPDLLFLDIKMTAYSGFESNSGRFYLPGWFHFNRVCFTPKVFFIDLKSLFC
jgi:DNA-binding NarL/FixJ family response regulator